MKATLILCPLYAMIGHHTIRGSKSCISVVRCRKGIYLKQCFLHCNGELDWKNMDCFVVGGEEEGGW